jgi:hypothetical protein
MPPIFRKNPPIDIVLQVLGAFGLKSIQDGSWFSKKHVRLDLFESVLLDLEPYYMPCKAEDYLYNTLTELRAITILRQVLKTQNVSLSMIERGRGGVKTIWYQIRVTSLDENVGHVRFN